MAPLVNIPVSTPVLLFGAAILVIVYKIVSTVQFNARVRKLGARAPIRPCYAPLGLDFAYEMMTKSLRDLTYDVWDGLFRKYGYTVEAGVGQRVVLTSEPENIKAILATQFKDYGKGEQFRQEWHSFLGNGIFTTDGPLWHNSRQLIRPQFVKDRLSDIDIFEEHVQVLISKISGGQEIDTLDLMFRYTLDAATHFLLGQSVDSLQNAQTVFANAFYRAQNIQGMIARLG